VWSIGLDIGMPMVYYRYINQRGVTMTEGIYDISTGKTVSSTTLSDESSDDFLYDISPEVLELSKSFAIVITD